MLHDVKNFKSYYADPIYREHHLNYIKQKVICPICECNVMRCNMTKHKRSKIHILKQEINALKNNIKII